MLVVYFRQLCCSAFPFSYVNLGWEVSFGRVGCRRSGEGEGSYPAGGISYPRLVLLCPLSTCVPRRFTQSRGQSILSTFAMNVLRKWDHFWGGCPPHSSPRWGLGFRGKVESPFRFIKIRWNLHLYNQLGCWVCKLQKKLGNPF
jgi:hypothetical protein